MNGGRPWPVRSAARGSGLRVHALRVLRKLRQGVRWYVLAIAAAIFASGLIVFAMTTGNVRWGVSDYSLVPDWDCS